MEEQIVEIDYILDFVLDWAEQMLINGANLEKITDSTYSICAAYRLKKVNVFTLNCFLTISAKSAGGEYHQREKCVRSSGINMVKLDRLSKLATEVCDTTPKPQELKSKLIDAVVIENVFPTWFVGFGIMMAIAAITSIFGGSVKDTIVSVIISAFMFSFGFFFKRAGVNRIVCDGISTFIVSLVLTSIGRAGHVDDVGLLMVCTSFVLIPGIPMVNAFRNLLCGNEINGIIETVKVIVEIGVICGGYMLGVLVIGEFM